MVVPAPLWLSEPVPEITEPLLRLVDCQNCKEPALVIAPVIDVAGLVMMAVVPTLIVPPLVTALVFVVCARPVESKKRKAGAILKKKTNTRPHERRLAGLMQEGVPKLIRRAFIFCRDLLLIRENTMRRHAATTPPKERK